MAEIRIATAQDAAQISGVLDAAYTAAFPLAYPPEVCSAVLPIITRSNPRLIDSNTFFVAIRDGVLCGCGGWSFDRPGTQDRQVGLGHIRHFACHPDHQNHNIGRALFDTCVETARAAGIGTFECYASLNAEPFYAKVGFRRLRDFTPKVGPKMVPLPSVLMAASIG